MSDTIDEAYKKLVLSQQPPEPDVHIECKNCGSDNVDHRAGYRGEYICRDCGYFWQVGGRFAT